MNRQITQLIILFFILAPLVCAEAGRSNASYSSIKVFPGYPDTSDQDSGQDGDLPSDAEEDTKEKRSVDEFESELPGLHHAAIDPLLNRQYTYQHLLFKEHFRELVVPPPKA